MTSQTDLIVDRALADSLEIPPGVDRWLREVEVRARELESALRAAAADEIVIERVAEVLALTEAFLGDEVASPLHRLLRRPLAQLAIGSSAAAAFLASAETLFRDVEETLDARRGVEALRGRRTLLQERYGPRMPFFTRRFLGEAGVGDRELASVRRPSDVALLDRRLQAAAHQLERLARHLPATPDQDREIELRGGQRVHSAELWAITEVRLAERSPLHRARRTQRLRGLQSRQLRALGSQGGWSRTSGLPVHVVAEHLAARSLVGALQTWEDGALWSVLLRSAERARFGASADEDSWQPRVEVRVEHAHPLAADEGILYVVPLTSGFVYLTPTAPSPIRIWSLAPREGETVECRVFGEPGSSLPIDRIASELQPLFDGADAAEPAWYAMDRRASVDVISRYGEAWFGRLRSRGRLTRLDTPAWREGHDTATAVRVVASGTGSRGARPIGVGPEETVPRAFLGLTTRDVASPVTDCGVAWLRSPGVATAAAEDRLLAEAEVFRVLRRRRPYLALAELGRARSSGDSRAGLLYLPPLALPAGDTPLVRQWMREEPLPFVRTLARLFQHTREAGYALGVWHLEMFAFGLESAGSGNRLLPRGTLVAAPGAVRFGHPYATLGRTAEDAPGYENLRLRGFAPAVAAGEIALPGNDAAAFAALVLELLAPRPLLPSSRWVKWIDLTRFAEKHLQAFTDQDLAGRVVEALRAGDDCVGCMEIIAGLAEGSACEGPLA